MLERTGFEVVLASPPEYEFLVAEIYHDGKFVALISQERGAGCFEIETPACGLAEEEIARRVDLQGFNNAVEVACKRLSGETP